MPHLLDIPQQLPLLTLPDTVLFPHAMLPIYLLEANNLRLLEDALIGDRLIALAYEQKNELSALEDEADFYWEEEEEKDPLPSTIGTVSLIRACYRQADGRALIILQGLGRVQICSVNKSVSYSMAEIEVQSTGIGNYSRATLLRLQNEIKFLLKDYGQEISDLTARMLKILNSIENPQVFLELASSSLCKDLTLQQRLLETFNDVERFKILLGYLKRNKSQVKGRK